MSDSANDFGGAMVIGYGNPLRGDDAVGWLAAQRIAEAVDPRHVAVIGVHQLTPELAQPISRVDLAIFIDASHGTQPGEIRSVSLEPSAVRAPRSISHELTPQRLLWMAKVLYGRWPRAVLFTVTGADFGHAEQLSEMVEAACERVVAQVLQLVNRCVRDSFRGTAAVRRRPGPHPDPLPAYRERGNAQS